VVVEESTVMSKKQWMSGDDNDDDDGDSSSTDDILSKEEVSSEVEPTRWACFNDGDTTDSENDSIRNDMDSSDDNDD
jgi:hypothetical protein